jgi:formate hydrogenlyase subunit 3/multisubunit Na+/H+ antiporter MnhD subunit
MMVQQQNFGLVQNIYDPLELLNLVVAFAIMGAGLLSLVYIFRGGLQFIFSGGDEGKIKKAVDSIRYAIIGLVITILSFGVVAWVGRIFGYDLISYIKPEIILKLVNSLTHSVGQDITP